MPDMLVLPALQNFGDKTVNTKFGSSPFGSVLSYQHKMDDECVLNIYDGVAYPDVPVRNVMQNNVSIVLSAQQNVSKYGLLLTMSEIKKFEEQTRLQSRGRL